MFSMIFNCFQWFWLWFPWFSIIFHNVPWCSRICDVPWIPMIFHSPWCFCDFLKPYIAQHLSKVNRIFWVREEKTERNRQTKEREERDKYPVLIHTRCISTECQFTGNLFGHVPISTDKYRFGIRAARFWWNKRSRILSDCIQNSFRFHSDSIHSRAPRIKSQ